MDFVKLDYHDYVVIRDLMQDLEGDGKDSDLDNVERAVLARVRRIVELMEHKRSLSERRQPRHYRRPPRYAPSPEQRPVVEFVGAV